MIALEKMSPFMRLLEYPSQISGEYLEDHPS